MFFYGNLLPGNILPFKYEKDRIFNSGVSLKRVRENSQCTIVLDNDSLLESNPDLSPKACYDIANSAINHVVKSLDSSEMSAETNILSTSKDGQNIEDSLRDSLKMLYENAPPNSIKRSMMYVVGGGDIPVGVLNSINNLSSSGSSLMILFTAPLTRIASLRLKVSSLRPEAERKTPTNFMATSILCCTIPREC